MSHLLLEWHYFAQDGVTVTLYWQGNPIACTPGDGAEELARLIRLGAQAGAEQVEETITRMYQECKQ